MTVDMFNNQNIPALSSFEQEERPQHPPLLYVGKRFLVLTQMRIGNNSVFAFYIQTDRSEPDQTASWSSLIKAYTTCPFYTSSAGSAVAQW